jgi:D-alanyl-D-alanine carboxypeptidase
MFGKNPNMHNPRLALLFLFLPAFNLMAQELNIAKMDSLFNNLEAGHKAMGSVLITKNNSIIYKKSIGHAFFNNKGGKALSTDIRYRTGSITKMFTAVLIFQLIEGKKLSLDTKLSAYFKQFPFADSITIAHLLSHRSGLYNYTTDWDSFRFKSTSRDSLLSIIAKGKTEFTPGTKTSYSNSNYILLGYIIERITGNSFDKVLKKKIVSRLKLKDTYYGGKIDTASGEAFSYNYESGEWKKQPETDISAAGGAGGIISTTSDLTKFIKGLFALKLVNRSSLDQMVTIKDGVGMGVEKLPFFNELLYGHSGQIDYFQSWLLHFPKHNLTITYLSNGFGGVPINNILSGILFITFNREYAVPSFR